MLMNGIHASTHCNEESMGKSNLKGLRDLAQVQNYNYNFVYDYERYSCINTLYNEESMHKIKHFKSFNKKVYVLIKESYTQIRKKCILLACGVSKNIFELTCDLR